jgi:hypothetical protein
MKIPKSFLSSDFASSSGAVNVLQRDASRFLRRIASDLHLSDADFTLRSRKDSAKVAGSISLHTDSLCVLVAKAKHRPGISIVYRSHRNRDDHSGGSDNFVSLAQLASDAGYRNFISNLRVVAGLQFA